ncbi:MAG: Gfo/Idh/MocA family oxidoreductase [Armatimonadetes bacterium]|nr:Gfo/Idh/MocA family oxidoreductase [Armatimonadota bacterium]
MINLGLIGVGYWGPNLARNLNNTENAALAWVCDADEKSLGKISSGYPKVQATNDLTRMLAATDLDAVVVATPAGTHFEIAKQVLKAGKHALVEKPLAMSGDECDELIDLADSKNLKLMVGHTFLYSPPVLKLKEIVGSGEIGDVYYAYSTRVNLGRIRKDVNAMWNLAPHDIAIFINLFESAPVSVSAKGITHIQPGIEDVVFMYLDFPGNITVHVHISWLDPGKVRKLTLVGSKKMVVYDDANADAKIQIFDKGVTKVSNGGAESFTSFGEFQLLLRAGDVLIPKIAATEPLKMECQHFVDCIISGERPLTDGVHGKQVVRVLEAAQESMKSGACPVEVKL